MDEEKLLQILTRLLDEKFDQKLEPIKKNMVTKADLENTQENTIDVLSELIQTGYNLHEKRIKKVEEMLEIGETHKH